MTQNNSFKNKIEINLFINNRFYCLSNLQFTEYVIRAFSLPLSSFTYFLTRNEIDEDNPINEDSIDLYKLISTHQTLKNMLLEFHQGDFTAPLQFKFYGIKRSKQEIKRLKA
jgi:hypothetical protein